MLTPQNKLSDSIGAASGETYMYSVIRVHSDVDVTQAFATPVNVPTVHTEALIKSKTELKDLLDNCKPMHCHKITHRLYHKSSG